MTDAQGPPCINQCRYKPKDGKAEGDPKRAKEGLLCKGCAEKLRGRLSDIPIMYALLPEVLAPGSSQQYDGTTRTKQPEAPAPARLDVAGLLDRSRPARKIAPLDRRNPAHEPLKVLCDCGCGRMVERGFTGIRDPGDELWYELEDIPKVLSVVHTWAETLRCSLDPYRTHKDLDDVHTVSGECTYLRRAFDRLVEQDWIDECMTELNTVRVWLERVHGFLVGPSVGVCFDVECDGKIYRDRFSGIPACRVCHRVYNDPDDWIKLKLSDVG